MIEEIRRLKGDEGSSKTLEDYNLTVQEAINLLKSNNIPVILTEADKYIIDRPREYEEKGLDSLILVHKTRYIPNNSTIKSPKDAEAKVQAETTIEGKKYDYAYKRARNTVHFAVNGEVLSHGLGGWDDCKYVILIPFTDIPKEQIMSAAPMDTYTYGSVKLTPNTWILCPKGEIEEISKKNPGVQVLEYDGESVHGFANAFISTLGYRTEEIGEMKWGDNISNLQYSKLIDREGFKRYIHLYTRENNTEEDRDGINVAIEILKKVKENTFLDSQEKISNIYKELNDTNIGGNRQLYLKYYTKRVVINYDKLSAYFYSKLEQEGIHIPEEYIELLDKMNDICTEKEKSSNYVIGKTEIFDSIIPDDKMANLDKETIELVKSFINTYDGEKQNIKYIRQDIMNEILQRGALNGIAREQLEQAPEFLKKSQNPDEQAKEGIKASLERQQIMGMLNKLEEWYSPKPQLDMGEMPTTPQPPPPNMGEAPTMPPPPPPDLGEAPTIPPPPPPDLGKVPTMPPPPLPPNIGEMPETEIPQNEIDPNNIENFTDYTISEQIRIQLMKKYLEKSGIGKNFERDAREVLKGISFICTADEFIGRRINIDDTQLEKAMYYGNYTSLGEAIKGVNAIVNALTKLEKSGILTLDVIKALTQEEKLSDINATIHSVKEYFRDSIDKKFER